MQGKSNGEKKTEDSSCSLPSHFWSTSHFTCYIQFQSSGSQESNASNRVWFGAEMRKLWPSETTASTHGNTISQGDFHLAKFGPFIFPLCENAFEILCFSTHAPPTSQIFLALIFSRVNSFCNLVFSRHKALSCNFAIYRGAQHLQIEGDIGWSILYTLT